MLRNRLVHAAIRILEYAQTSDFANEPVDFPLAVRIRDADKQHIPRADGLLGERRIDAVRGGVDHVDARFAYPLQYDSHTATLSRGHGGMSRPCDLLLGFGAPFPLLVCTITCSARGRFEPNADMSYTEKSGLIRGLIIQKGLIGFDGDLFVAGKRAENAESTRNALREQISAKSNRTEFALAA